jgi:predicted ATPase/class 3 adenylate cyclase
VGTHTGQAAFLFTDVEGSTRLWEDHPEEMSAALVDHNRILIAAIERFGGRVFSTAGDSFAAVFVAGPDAIAAAVESQLALRRPDVRGDILRVRMAVHVGEAERRGDDYFGPALNRCARLMAAGHGGQILVSLAAADSYHTQLGGISLVGLGEHRLKDLTRSEHVFQVAHPDLPSEFPSLRSLDVHSHNLPIQVTSFIGREKELDQVRELLGATRLLTLTGVGGTGKTRLALQTTAETLASYSDGAWLVELGPVTDPDLLPQVTASVLRMRPHPGRSMLETLVDGLESQEVLLVLDNCEHVIEAAASLTDAILRSCPGIKVLATSREALGVSGEVAYRVPSLSLPDGAADVLASESGRLFAERAAAAKPGFAITPSIAPAVSRICRRLDGIPLAVELAAVRVRALSPDQIAGQLEQSFRILTGGNRAALPRQQTLEASIRWSYNLLTPDEQELLGRLSVFSGGFTLESAGAVYLADGVELLLNLVDKSLVVPEEADGDVRYRLLETIRTFATERLVDAGESEVIRRRHADFYLGLAERAQPEVHGPDQKQWLDRLDAEHDNLRAALEWSIEAEPLMIALRLTTALVQFWNRRGHWTGAYRWIDRFLSRVGDLEDPLLALLMSEAAALFGTQGDFERVEPLATRGLEMSRRTADDNQVAWATVLLGDNLSQWWDDRERALPLLEEGLAGVRQGGDRWREARALYALSITLSTAGDLERAGPLLAEALSLFEALGDHWQTANVMRSRAWVLSRLGRFEEAAQLSEESVGLLRSLEAEVWAAHSLYTLGQMLTHLGQYSRAGEVLDEAITTLRKAGDLGCRADVLGIQAFLALSQGELDSARKLLEESLRLARTKRDPFTTAFSLDYLARVAARSGSPDEAARLLGASRALRNAPAAPADQDEYDQLLEGLRATLGQDVLTRQFADGEAMTLEEAIDYGLAVASSESTAE